MVLIRLWTWRKNKYLIWTTQTTWDGGGGAEAQTITKTCVDHSDVISVQRREEWNLKTRQLLPELPQIKQEI